MKIIATGDLHYGLRKEGDRSTEEVAEKVAAWNDRKYIKWNYSDCDFLNNILEKMRTHIESIHNRVEKIICITHHLPFKNMTVKTNHLPWDFAQAYLGSVKIGELFLNYKKIKLSICAHSHREKIIEEGHVKCINVGSTYASKKLLTLDF